MAERLRIVVLNIAASKTGALSVLRDFYREVVKDPRGAEWFFIVGAAGLIEENKDCPGIHVIVRDDVKRSKLKRLFFDHLSGASFIKSLDPDVVFSMQNTLPRGVEKMRTSSGKRIRSVIYLHQPLGFQKVKQFSFLKRYEREMALYQYLIAPEIDSSLKRADEVIVQTRWMKDAVCEKDGLSEDSVRIVTPDMGSVDELCKPEISRDSSLFLYPAGSMIYKDHQCIVDAAEILKNKGIDDFRVIFTQKLSELPWLRLPEKVRENIEFRGMIPREELIPLYQKAVLLFPSYIETFGYPLAEAAYLNTPVISADTPFAREILENAKRKRFFRISSPEELSILMEESVNKGWGEEIGSLPKAASNEGSSWSRVADILIGNGAETSTLIRPYGAPYRW